MSVHIRWSPRAINGISDQLEYIEIKWGKAAASKILSQIESILETVLQHPELYPRISKEKNIHRCVVAKQLILYYRYSSETIELITF